MGWFAGLFDLEADTAQPARLGDADLWLPCLSVDPMIYSLDGLMIGDRSAPRDRRPLGRKMFEECEPKSGKGWWQ